MPTVMLLSIPLVYRPTSWGKSELPAIFHAVLDAVREAELERNKPLRTWFLAGMGVLCYPGLESLLSD